MVNQPSSITRDATEVGICIESTVGVNSSEAHVGSSSEAIEWPEQSLSSSLPQLHSPDILHSTVSPPPSAVVAVDVTSSTPVNYLLGVIGSTQSDSTTDLEGSSEQVKFLCSEKSSTSSVQATSPRVATERSTELIMKDGMPITEAADSGSEHKGLHITPEQFSVCESCSLPGKGVPAFGVHASDTSDTTEKLRSPCDNTYAQEKHTLQPIIQLGISAILKKATRSVESLQFSAHSGWSSSSKGAGQEDTGPMAHDIQSVSDVNLVRSEQSGGTVSDYSHHQAPHNAIPHGPYDLSSATVGGVQGATQWVEPSGSSLVFVPRGLSGGPRAPSNLPLPPANPGEDTSVNTTGADLAPDLEMDLYGISYSLESLDHFQQ